METLQRCNPAVFAVKNDYQIMIPVTSPVLAWVKVGEECYYDDSNGVLRSDTKLHKISVPAKALDEAKGYTLCLRPVIERKPYFSEVGEVVEKFYEFRPIPKEHIRAYQIADAHGTSSTTCEAAEYFVKQNGGLDFLILNGDVLDHSGSIENFDIHFDIASRLTGGNIPVVFSRGNHDLRGICAEKLSEFAPGEMGHFYYSFRMGNVWGLVLDCGEDKEDGHPEYAHTICCHDFRRRETKYLENLIAHAEEEYNAPGVEHRMVFSHVPFNRIDKAPFDIEQDTYRHWVELLGKEVKADFMLCGHMHKCFIDMPGCEVDAYGQKFPVVIGSELNYETRYFVGCGIVLEKGSVKVTFNDSEKVISETVLKI